MDQTPVTLLKAFEAAGRSGSFRVAAAELRLTPSAVSHSIRKLETLLGIHLFERDGRAVRLTGEGAELMHHIGRGFAEFRHGMEAVSRRGPGLLRLHCAPSFAAQWLSPRLSNFLAETNTIEVRLSASTEYTRFLTDEFDADIVYGEPPHRGLVVRPLGEETVMPLCSPKLAESIHSPSDLLRHPLIESDNKRIRWSAWFAANGLEPPVARGSRFDRSFMAIAAAVNNLGVALESTRLAEAEIASGRLVAPLKDVSTDLSYIGHYLAYPSSMAYRRPLQLFATWLMRELSAKGNKSSP